MKAHEEVFVQLLSFSTAVDGGEGHFTPEERAS